MSGEVDLERVIAKAIRHVDSDQLRDLLRNNAELEEIKAKLGPQNAEELWHWVKDRVGVELSRTTVCEGHCSQLEMAWELYSFAVTRVLWVMSRGGGKTSLVAWIDECQAEHFPGWGAFTIGANQTQGQRKYEYLLPLVVEGGVIGGKELDHVIRSIATETQLKNGSKMEIARGSSPENANGPRVPRLHRDETELMDPKTRTQAGNIPAGRKLRDGRYAPAQILDTSTMKYAEGHIDKQIQDYKEAKEKGVRPRMEVRTCCIFEVAEENPYCRSVPDEQRRARLTELGLDPDQKCDCDTYVSDVWPAEDLDDDGEDVEPEDRTLESVCQGRFFRSRGYKGIDDIQTLFLENPRETWDAEQECAQPATEGAYIRSYSQTRNGIKGYRPDPENGPIDMGIDWGADDEHACFPGSVILSGPKPEGISCRPYSGELIEIVVASGEVLPVTPNHLVLTERGWMPAKDVGRGDYLFRDPRGEHHQGVGPEDHDQMRPFADVFDAAKVAGSAAVGRALVHPLDFHGDVAREAEIDVVGSYARLRHDVGLSEIFEPALDQALLFGDPPRAGLSPHRHGEALFFGGLRANSLSCGSALIGAHALASLGAHVGESELDGLAGRPSLVASLPQSLAKSRMSDPEFLGQSKDRLPAVMTPSQVVDVRKKHFCGHVFNAETTPHWYLANGFVVSNCIWFQTLERPVKARGFKGGEKLMPVGAVVAFAEIYKSGIGNTALGRLVLEREAEWIMEFPGWRVGANQQKPARYPDSANLGARLDWSKELGLETTIYRKDFMEELKLVRTRIGKRGGFFIDIGACEWFDKSIRAWRQENGREVRNFATHPLAAFRYREHVVHHLERRRKGTERASNPNEMPQAAEDQEERQEERQRELALTGARGPAVELITAARTEEDEDYMVGGAEDSPLRDSARSMPGVPTKGML